MVFVSAFGDGRHRRAWSEEIIIESQRYLVHSVCVGIRSLSSAIPASFLRIGLHGLLIDYCLSVGVRSGARGSIRNWPKGVRWQQLLGRMPLLVHRLVAIRVALWRKPALAVRLLLVTLAQAGVREIDLRLH